MWPFKSSRNDLEPAEELVDALLQRLGQDRRTLIDFSADQYLKNIDLSKVDLATVELLFENVKSEQTLVTKLRKIELAAFSAILLIYLNLSNNVNFLAFQVPSSEAVLAALLFVHSALQMAGSLSQLDALTKRKILSLILERCPQIDPSGMRRLLLGNTLNAVKPWNSSLRSGASIPGWRFFIVLLFLFPLLLHLLVFVIAIPALVILAAWDLASNYDWAWVYLVILSGTVLGSISQVIFVPLIEIWGLDYLDTEVLQNFSRNRERYGLRGALTILEEEVSDIESESDATSRRKGRSSPVARLYWTNRSKWPK